MDFLVAIYRLSFQWLDPYQARLYLQSWCVLRQLSLNDELASRFLLLLPMTRRSIFPHYVSMDLLCGL